MPSNSYYPVHDFLDNTVTIESIWIKDSSFLNPYAELPGLLNGIVPAGALGISDFAVPQRLLGIFPIPVALGITQIIGRLLSYFAIFHISRLILGNSRVANFSSVIAGFCVALAPYWPLITWTIAGIAISALAVAKLYLKSKPFALWVALLAVTPQMASFALGGFLQPVIATSFLIFAWVKNKKSFALTIGAIVNVVSTFFSALGLALLFFSEKFISHREEWPGAPLFDSGNLSNFVQQFPKIFFDATYHFGTVFNTDLAGSVSRISVTLVFLYLSSFLIFSLFNRLKPNKDKSKKKSSNEDTTVCLRWLIFFLALQIFLSLLCTSEITGLTNFSGLSKAPFQISRIIVLSPILWGLLIGIISYLGLVAISSRIRGISALLVMLVIVGHLIVVNPALSNSIKTILGMELRDDFATYGNYFEETKYQKIMEFFNTNGIDPKVLSFDLDPMVATQNGFTSLDGYVYNYPLEYKHKFAEIIYPDLTQPGGDLEYYRDWGSRLYLFDRGVSTDKLKFNWCAAKFLGAEAILSGRELVGQADLISVGKVENIYIYKINSSCTKE